MQITEETNDAQNFLLIMSEIFSNEQMLINLKIEIRRIIEKWGSSECSNEDNKDISYFSMVNHIITATERFPTCNKENPFDCLVEISAFVHSVVGYELARESKYLVFSIEFYKEAKNFLSLHQIVSKYVLKKFELLLSPLKNLKTVYSGILAVQNIRAARSRVTKYKFDKIDEITTVNTFEAFLSNLQFHSNLKFEGGRFTLRGKDMYEVNLQALTTFNDYRRTNILKGFLKKNECRISN